MFTRPVRFQMRQKPPIARSFILTETTGLSSRFRGGGGGGRGGGSGLIRKPLISLDAGEDVRTARCGIAGVQIMDHHFGLGQIKESSIAVFHHLIMKMIVGMISHLPQTAKLASDRFDGLIPAIQQIAPDMLVRIPGFRYSHIHTRQKLSSHVERGVIGSANRAAIVNRPFPKVR